MRAVFVLLMITMQSVGAQQTKTVTGNVVNEALDGVEVTIVNIGLGVGTVTDINGIFTIPVRMGDTLNVSAISYATKKIKISKDHLIKGTISIELNTKITELAEVLISDSDLTGDLQKDMAAIALKKTTITASELGLPENARPTMTAEERRYYSATAGAGPVGMLINAITGRTKMLKKHLEISKLQAKIERNRDKFTTSFYVESLGIPESLIEDFVYYVLEDPKSNDYLSSKTVLELLDFMKLKAPSYLKLKRDHLPEKL